MEEGRHKHMFKKYTLNMMTMHVTLRSYFVQMDRALRSGLSVVEVGTELVGWKGGLSTLKLGVLV
jgi:hypothetical protein